jgi:hypothetical protein
VKGNPFLERLKRKKRMSRRSHSQFEDKILKWVKEGGEEEDEDCYV